MLEFDGIEGITDQFYYNNCACNEYDALIRRHCLGDIAGFKGTDDPSFIKLEEEVSLMADEYIRNFGYIQRLDHSTVMAHTRAFVRKRYIRAAQNIVDRRFDLDHALTKVTAFVKYEKNHIIKIDKPARLVQYRTFEYCYLLKSFILNHPLAVKSGNLSWNGQNTTTIFAKMHNSMGIARILQENWNSFMNPVAICLDHSKFDGHYNRALLDLEHFYWLSLGNNNHLLRLLLKKQLHNRGRTMNGIRYESHATRCSGGGGR